MHVCYQIKWEKRQVHNCYLIKDMNLIAQVCVIEPTWQVQILMCKRTQSQVNQTQWEYTQGQSGCLMPKALTGSSLGLCLFFAVLWVKGDSLLPQLRNINYLSSVHTTCMPRDCIIDFLHFFPYSLGVKKKSFSTWNIGIECLYLQQLCFVIRFFCFYVPCFLDYNRSYR